MYSQIGNSGTLEARPSVVHFGGFQTGAVHKQAVLICNTGIASRRLHIIPPTTPFFKAGLQPAQLL